MVVKIPARLAIAAVGIGAASLANAAAQASRPATRPASSPAAPTADGRDMSWAEPMPGATTDAKLRLPVRVRDRRSGIVLMLIKPGRFLLGSPDKEGEGNEHPQHEVQIRTPFYLGETEVTIGQWRQFAERTKFKTEGEGTGGVTTKKVNGVEKSGYYPEATWKNPLPFYDFTPTDEHPVTQVSWNDAMAFCKEHGLRLPTEAEWEYACRAGTKTRYWWGNSEKDGKGKGNLCDQSVLALRPSGWDTFPFNDGFLFLAPVKQFAANPWGLHDMHGNAAEWCSDWYDTRWYANPSARTPDPHNETAAQDRVDRGGSWLMDPDGTRAARRGHVYPTYRSDSKGFRVARDI